MPYIDRWFILKVYTMSIINLMAVPLKRTTRGSVHVSFTNTPRSRDPRTVTMLHAVSDDNRHITRLHV